MKQHAAVRLDVVQPPIVWTQNDIESAFQAYLQNDTICNKEDTGNQPAPWRLFQLKNTAVEARLASAFDNLMALEHVHGFTPLPHQIATATRVLQELRGRAILADEVGLGKTIEAGLVMKEYQLRGLAKKMLVLVPASLVLQWTRELNEKFRLNAFAQRNEWSWEQYDVVVASLDTAKREPHRSVVLNTQWDIVVVDEAHKLKNRSTKNWQTVNQIPNKFLLLLTATPIQNHLQELHTLITLLKPGQLGDSAEFASEHMATSRQAKAPDVLKQHLADVMIRNRRRDGGATLPDRHVQIVPIDLSPEERALYEGVQTFLRKEYQERQGVRASMLPLITLQREICSSPYAAMITLEKMLKRSKQQDAQTAIASLMKLAEQITRYTKVEAVLQMLDEIDDKCIVFTEYRATQDFIMYMLRKRGIPAVPFRGGFGRGKKDWMKDLFAKRMKVLVATESGGEGINLQFCHHMVNFDLPWNPMRLEQRIGRIHRLGQDQEVHIYNLSTRNTIEAHIVNLLQEKIRMFETVIGELDYIVGLDQKDNPFEQRILEMSLTSNSDDELGQRLESLGDELVLRLQRDQSPLEQGAQPE